MAQNKLEKLVTLLQNTIESLVNKVNSLEQKIGEQNLMIKKQGDTIRELLLPSTVNTNLQTTSGGAGLVTKQQQAVRSARLRATSAITAVVGDRKTSSTTPKGTATATPRTPVATKAESSAPLVSPQIVVEPLAQPLGTSDGRDMNDQWTEVTYRRPRALRNLVRGVAEKGSLEAADHWKYYHLFYVKEGTSDKAITEHLQNLCTSEKCSVETLKSRGQYSSFKIGVLSKYCEQVTDGKNWPQGICLKEWRNGFRKHDDAKQNKSNPRSEGKNSE